MDAHVAIEQRQPSPVDEIVQLRFAFTDPRGRVTRWGAGAELLLGIEPDRIVGQPLFDVALAGADGGWRAFLQGDQTECPATGLEVTISRSDDQSFPCQIHLVPVLLADGLDFSQFAADLNSNDMDSLDAFKQRHERVLGLIESAARDGATYAEGERLAGLIATFWPLGEGPVTPGERIDEALTRAERAEREVEDLRDPLSRVAAEFAELRAGLEGVRARIEELEVQARTAVDAGGLVSELGAALGERLEAIEARHEAGADAEALAAEVGRAVADQLDRVLAGRMEEELPGRIEQAVAGRMDELLPGRIEQAVAGRMEELPHRIEQALAGRVAEPSGGGTDEASAARIEEAVTRRLEGTVAARIEDEVARGVEQALAGRVGEEVARRIEEPVTRHVEGTIAGRIEEAVGSRIEEALGAAREAREEAQQVAREVRSRRPAATRPLPIGFYSSDAQPAGPDREVLPEFDDVATPLAALSLDGRFTRLNGAFRDLVGYSEEEFAAARWPSPTDPEQVQAHRELKRALTMGEIEDASIETAYMHREGLLVPLAGRMCLVRDERGAPDHLLFRVGPA